jgi:hypothetical protein
MIDEFNYPLSNTKLLLEFLEKLPMELRVEWFDNWLGDYCDDHDWNAHCDDDYYRS